MFPMGHEGAFVRLLPRLTGAYIRSGLAVVMARASDSEARFRRPAPYRVAALERGDLVRTGRRADARCDQNPSM